MRGKFGKAMCPPCDEWLVKELFADDDVEHGKRKRVVCARPDLQPYISLFSERRAAGIDDDDARIVLERFEYVETCFTVWSR